MKRPAFQFYPADWRNDPALKLCSLAARGLWMELMCLMHAGDEYGYLRAAGRSLEAADIARLVGATPREVKAWMAELERNGVSSRDDSGCVFSRRMVRDEELRQRRADGGSAGAEFGHLGAEHGKKGGRPRKETGDKKPPLKPAPSSSSSSSSSSSDESEGSTISPPVADVDETAYALTGTFEGHDDIPAHTPNPVARFAIALTRAGFQSTPLNPKLIAYVEAGGTVEHLQAIAAMRECQGNTVGYVLGFAIRELTAPKPSLPATVQTRNQSAAAAWLAQEAQ